MSWTAHALKSRVARGEAEYALRTCSADGSSYGGFRWPEGGEVSAPDWDPRAKCGNGLHGLLRGEGDGALLCWDKDARWLVVEVPAGSWVDFQGKVKFPRCAVVYCGDQKGATSLLQSIYPDAKVVGGTLSLRWHDGSRYRVATFYVGEDGIEPNVAYRCENGRPLKVQK